MGVVMGSAFYRLTEIVVAITALIVFVPLLCFVIVLIKAGSRGPAILCQTRLGRGRIPFKLFKLRTMSVETLTVPTHLVNDASITPLGRVLRRYRIDELPQLLNVIIGDMSLVGPRPCLPTQLDIINAREIMGVFVVRPGMTGLAQISNVDMSDPGRLSGIDATYVSTRSAARDLKILFHTVTGMGIDRRITNRGG